MKYIIDGKRTPKGAKLIPVIADPEVDIQFEPNSLAEVISKRAMDYLKEGQKDLARIELKKAYVMGDLWAGSALAYGYSAGWFGHRNYRKAVALSKELVKKKDPASMSNLAYFYEHGYGVHKSRPKAIRLYQEAIALGDVCAMENLARLYLHCPGYINVPLALELLHRAVEIGTSGEAFNQLGVCYEYGNGLDVDYEKALSLYSHSLEIDTNPVVEKNLARIKRKLNIVEPENKLPF